MLQFALQTIYPYLKALHIVFVVTWFAGLFYMVRLFIYLTEANQKEEPDKTILTRQLGLMSQRLWNIITQPSAFITIVLGSTLIALQPYWLSQPFMHFKLSFVAILLMYHLGCGIIHRRLQKGIYTFASVQLRIYNEIATILLCAIVFLIVIKDTLQWMWGPLVFILAGGISLVVVKTTNWLYKKISRKK